jgi:hypothetical protein
MNLWDLEFEYQLVGNIERTRGKKRPGVEVTGGNKVGTLVRNDLLLNGLLLHEYLLDELPASLDVSRGFKVIDGQQSFIQVDHLELLLKVSDALSLVSSLGLVEVLNHDDAPEVTDGLGLVDALNIADALKLVDALSLVEALILVDFLSQDSALNALVELDALGVGSVAPAVLANVRHDVGQIGDR